MIKVVFQVNGQKTYCSINYFGIIMRKIVKSVPQNIFKFPDEINSTRNKTKEEENTRD